MLEEEEEGNGEHRLPDADRQKLKNALRFLKKQDCRDAKQ